MKYSWVNKRASYKVMVERGVVGNIQDPYTVHCGGGIRIYERNEFPMSLLVLSHRKSLTFSYNHDHVENSNL